MGELREMLKAQQKQINQLTQITDNNPLSHLALAKVGAMEHSWEAQLSAFDFEVRY